MSEWSLNSTIDEVFINHVCKFLICNCVSGTLRRDGNSIQNEYICNKEKIIPYRLVNEEFFCVSYWAFIDLFALGLCILNNDNASKKI